MASKVKTTIAVLGVGGYGRIYVNPLLDQTLAAHHNVKLIAGVEPNTDAGPSLEAMKKRGLPVYATSAELYANHRPDVVVIASPIHFHCQQTIEAMQHGANVLCEKPLCATPDQGRLMKAAEQRYGRQVAIGYQWSFCPSIQRLKADILAGVLGRPLRCKSLVLWPRDEAYYTRNGWAGRRLTRSGLPVFDSPVNNACAHFLHNLLYLLGPEPHLSAAPQSVTAELYRANAIETFDTAALRVRLDEDVELLMVTSHATAETREPLFELHFDRAVVTYSASGGGRLRARFVDGTERDYGEPAGSATVDKLWSALKSFRSGTPVLCGIDAALPQAMVVAASHASTPEAVAFPRSLVRVSGEPGSRSTNVIGLAPVLGECYDSWRLPSETEASWAVPANVIVLREEPTLIATVMPVAAMRSTVITMVPQPPEVMPN